MADGEGDNNSNVARMPANDDSHSDEETFDNLELSFDDIADDELFSKLNPSPRKPKNEPKKGAEPGGMEEEEEEADVKIEDYILGTLIVRVVAARELESMGFPGFGKMLFGGDASSRHAGSHRGRQSGSANPYASVRFGNTTQRTSEVYDTVDPIWPRGESMFMDVLQPRWETVESSPNSYLSKQNSQSSASSSSSSSLDNKSVDKTAMKQQAKKAPPQTSCDNREVPIPILTVAVFHASENGRAQKIPKKGKMSGDSDDRFLGMTSVDLTTLITGKTRVFDEWLPLSGSKSDRAAIRIVCEYEPSDALPHVGDWVRFTSYCDSADIYPLVIGQRYKVEEVDGDDCVISHTTPEGWVTSFVAHRNLLICEERHIAAMDVAQDELASITARLAHSPLMETVNETMNRLPNDGLVNVGVDAVRGGASLLTRWLESGIGTAFSDIAFATNWDGRFNPNASETLSAPSVDDESDISQQEMTPPEDRKLPASDNSSYSPDAADPLPNMPPCPITGEPMLEPVVAADGHTYERKAIARWLETSNKSPLTGSVLLHKNLVPNYMLLSSLQEVGDGKSGLLSDQDSAAAAGFDLPQGVDTDGATTEVDIS